MKPSQGPLANLYLESTTGGPQVCLTERGTGQEQKLLEGGALRPGVRCSKGGVTPGSDSLIMSLRAARWHTECHSARFTVEPLSNPIPLREQPGFT